MNLPVGWGVGSQAFDQAQIGIDMRKRRIASAQFLENGMSVEDYDLYNTLQVCGFGLSIGVDFWLCRQREMLGKWIHRLST